eukprot:1140166-Pelagomonas_calceolata.AAC.2
MPSVRAAARTGLVTGTVFAAAKLPICAVHWFQGKKKRVKIHYFVNKSLFLAVLAAGSVGPGKLLMFICRCFVIRGGGDSRLF